MNVDLDLKYRIRAGEEEQFLDEDEKTELQAAIGAALARLPATAGRDEQIAAARAARKAHLTERLPGHLVPVRVSSFLLRSAVEMRYKTAAQGGVSVQIPRKAEGKTYPGRWWGEIVEILDASPTNLDLEPAVANWLVFTVWQDDKVQNGFPPSLQLWVNVLDAEMERIADELQPSRRK